MLNFIFILELKLLINNADSITCKEFLNARYGGSFLSTISSFKQKESVTEYLKRQPTLFHNFEQEKASIYKTSTDQKHNHLVRNCSFMYGIALVVLLIYSIVVFFVNNEHKWLGFVVSAEVIVLDIVFVLFLMSRPHLSSGSEILLLGGSRFAFISFGFNYWFIGSCVVYLLVGSRIIKSIVNRYVLQEKSESATKSNEQDDTKNKIRFSEFLNPDWMDLHIFHGRKVDLPSNKCTEYVLMSLQSPLASFGILSFTLIVCTLIVAIFIDLTKIKLIDGSHHQYIFGIGSIAASWIILVFLSFWQIYSRNDMNISKNRKSQIALLIFEILVIVTGIILFLLTKSYLLLACMIFLPLIFILTLLEFNHIRHHDWTFIFPPKYRNPTMISFWNGFLHGGLPKSDYKVLIYVACEAICMYSMGALISFGFSPVVGWGIAGILLVLRLTALPITKYFLSLEFNIYDGVSSAIGFIIYVGSFVSIYFTYQNTSIFQSNINQAAFGLIAISYPTLLFLISGTLQWKEQNYPHFKDVLKTETLKKDAGYQFIVSSYIIVIMLIIAFMITVTVALDLILGLGIIIGTLLLCFLGFIILKWKQSGFYLGKKLRILIIALLIGISLLGMYLALTDKTSNFLGFSICWLAVCLLMLSTSIALFMANAKGKTGIVLQVTTHIFPVFTYDTTLDDTVLFNKPFLIAFASIMMILVWSTSATIVESQTLGLAVTAAIWCIAYTKTRRLRQNLINEFTDIFFSLQPRVLDKARTQSAKQQLTILDVKNNKFSAKLKKIVSEANKQHTTYSTVLHGLFDKSIEKIQLLPMLSSKSKISEKEKQKYLESYDQELMLESALSEIESRFFAHFIFLILSKTKSKIRHDVSTFEEFLNWLSNTLNMDTSIYRNISHKQLIYNIIGDPNLVSTRRRSIANNSIDPSNLSNQIKNDKLSHEEEEQLNKQRRPSNDFNNIEISNLRKLKKLFIKFKISQIQNNETNRQQEENEHKKREEELNIENIENIAITTHNNFQTILSKFNKSNKYIDNEFPSNQNALFISGERDVSKYPHSAVQRLRFAENTEGMSDGWHRPEDIIKKNNNTRNIFTNINSHDIIQGQIGDCYLLSSLGILAVKEKSGEIPGVLKNIITPNDKYSESGAYLVRFYKRGKEIPIIIDDQLPILSNNKIAFGHSRDINEWWLSLIEKAYAKMYKSYQAIEGGKIHHCLVDLTNGYSSEVRLDSVNARQEKDIIWTKIMSSYKAGYLLGAGSNPGSDANTKNGIAFGHAYGIVKLYQDNKYKLIQLQNPWGSGEWEGDWSDNDTVKWTKYYKNKLYYENNDQGTFWMNFSDFCNYFHNVYICRLLKPQIIINEQWDNFTSTGPIKPLHNPQFYLITPQSNTIVFITLQQDEFTDEKENKDENEDENEKNIDDKLAYMTFFVLDNGDNKNERIKMIGRDMIIGSGNNGKFINDREVTGEIKLQKSNYPYKILPLSFKKGMEAHFTLQIFCNNKIECKIIDDPQRPTESKEKTHITHIPL